MDGENKQEWWNITDENCQFNLIILLGQMDRKPEASLRLKATATAYKLLPFSNPQGWGTFVL